MPYRREGTCNQCGQCCGAAGSPNQASPFPKNWPVALRVWSLDDVNEVCPLLGLFGLAQLGEDLVGVPPENVVGLVRIGGKPFYYVWINDGQGPPYRDASEEHDGTEPVPECPFLKPDPGDGSRPCALVGSKEEGARTKFCRPEERPEYEPATDIWSDRAAAQWQADHPDCSYTWVEVEE